VDGDGTADACDPCPFDNPDDSDGDSVCDADDVCPEGDDTVDTDGDGEPDTCDPCPIDNPNDSDGDSVCDSDDICPEGDDTVDTDGDDTPDDCDPCPVDNPDDSDGDSVCDADDVCPEGDDTVDTDSDGEPDTCDPCPIDNPNDSDGDSVCDSDDICEGHDDAIDTDLDSAPDGCDPCPIDNPDDSDGDGICDSDPIPVPNGLIIAFTGSEIPDGWLICDGTAETPDLRGRFIVGVLDEEPGVIGGSDTHDHEGFTDITEMETGYSSPGSRSCGPPGCWCTAKASNESHNHDMTHDHTLDPDSSLPPFFEVIYLINEDAEYIPAHGILASTADRTALSSTWEVCDGETDCPDLRNRFLKGSSDTTTGSIGGSDSHDHGGWSGTETSTGSFHGSYGMTVTAGGPSATDMSHTHSYEHEHSLSNESTIPPYQYTQWVSPVEDSTTALNTIGMWSGNTDDLPMGWVLCDGSGGTPDFSGLFIRGASSDAELGLIGGDIEHEHLISEDGGGETGTNGGGNGQCSGGGGLMDFHSHSVPAHDHTMAPHPNEPPYFTMAYIMYAPAP
jgi:hypothetical protein